MTISLSDLAFFSSAAGEMLLAALSQEDLSDSNMLALISRLRKTYTGEQASAALTMARLRQRAAAKFGDVAARMWFNADGLQQASDPLVRTYRADIFVQRHATEILDLCCGIGADSMAFAQAGLRVLGVDIDPVRVEMAQHNARVLDLHRAQFEVADVLEYTGETRHIFFDPARRDDEGGRIFNVEDYIPPLSTVKRWVPEVHTGRLQQKEIAVKLSPGVKLEQLEAYHGCVEFISVSGDLKEAVLWLDGGVPKLKATLIDSRKGAEPYAPADVATYHWQREGEEPDYEISQPRVWLIEPDPALIRAGLVRDAAAAFGSYLLDKTIAYITADERPESPWVRAWEILDWMPLNLKKLRAYLRERGVGTLTIKKRGSPLLPEQVIAQLRLKGSESCTLVLTRCQGEPIVIVCADFYK